MTTTISSKGQITVPVQVRKALALRPGVKLKIELKNSAFLVSKAPEKSFFAQFRGRCSRQAPWKSGDLALEKMRGPVSRKDVDER
jgi:AbrB family looped-hinge helix DNA binding protein